LECDVKRNNNAHDQQRHDNTDHVTMHAFGCAANTRSGCTQHSANSCGRTHTHPKISFVENRAGVDETPVKYSNRCGRTPDAPKISVSRPTVSIQQKQSISCVCHCMDSTRQSKRVSGETPHTKSTLTCETTSTNNTTRLKFM
jgi:hypothetical protein